MPDTLNRKAPETLMGFDFGLKRIGVAFGQAITQSASPLVTLPAQNGIPNWEVLKKWIAEWQPKALVVGIPLLMDDREQPLTHLARKFANRLAAQTRLPVYHVDERLTTRAVRQELSERSDLKSFNHQKVDALAACLLVESWYQAPFWGRL